MANTRRFSASGHTMLRVKADEPSTTSALNPTLVRIMPADEEPNDCSLVFHSQRPVVAVHTGGPIRPNPFEPRIRSCIMSSG
jgi:hypothetical protein